MTSYETHKTPSAKIVKVFYEKLGEGQPIMLIHGWPLSHEMKEYQLDDLVAAA